MLSLSLYAVLTLSKTKSSQKLFDYDCMTLYVIHEVPGPHVSSRPPTPPPSPRPPAPATPPAPPTLRPPPRRLLCSATIYIYAVSYIKT